MAKVSALHSQLWDACCVATAIWMGLWPGNQIYMGIIYGQVAVYGHIHAPARSGRLPSERTALLYLVRIRARVRARVRAGVRVNRHS